MNDILNERATIGGNNPPTAIEVRERNKDLFDTLDQLAAADSLIPERIATDEQEGQAQDLHTKIRKTIKMAEAMHKDEKAPYDAIVKQLKATFAIPMEKAEKAGKVILDRITVYKEEKAAAERRRREEEAQRQREEAERLAREAAEAERRRLEAEAARRAEEERARKAEEEKLRQLAEARAAEDRARQAREEAARLEAEAKERKAREDAEAKLRAEQAERDAAAEAIRAEQRRIEQEAHDNRMAELKAQREEEERKAKESREAAARARQERDEAEAAAAAAKKDEKAAAKETKNSLDDAVRIEKRADRLDNAAQASAAELSRGRGEYGSVGSLTTRWTWRMLDRDRIPLEQLRAYLLSDAVDAAVTRFMQAHRADLVHGQANTALLPGVVFEEITEARVA